MKREDERAHVARLRQRPRLRVRAAVEYLILQHGWDVTDETLKRWRVRRIGPKFHKVRGSVFYAPSDLDEFVAALLVASDA